MWDTLFEQIEVQSRKNYLKMLLPEEIPFRSNIKNKCKGHVQNWENMYVIIYR